MNQRKGERRTLKNVVLGFALIGHDSWPHCGARKEKIRTEFLEPLFDILLFFG